MLDRQKRSGFEGTLTPPRFMGRVAACRRTTRFIGLAPMTLDLEPARPLDRVDAFVRRPHHRRSQPAFANALLSMPTTSGLHPLEENKQANGVELVRCSLMVPRCFQWNSSTADEAYFSISPG